MTTDAEKGRVLVVLLGWAWDDFESEVARSTKGAMLHALEILEADDGTPPPGKEWMQGFAEEAIGHLRRRITELESANSRSGS